jgi:hypothetical protein
MFRCELSPRLGPILAGGKVLIEAKWFRLRRHFQGLTAWIKFCSENSYGRNARSDVRLEYSSIGGGIPDEVWVDGHKFDGFEMLGLTLHIVENRD